MSVNFVSYETKEAHISYFKSVQILGRAAKLSYLHTLLTSTSDKLFEQLSKLLLVLKIYYRTRLIIMIGRGLILNAVCFLNKNAGKLLQICSTEFRNSFIIIFIKCFHNNFQLP